MDSIANVLLHVTVAMSAITITNYFTLSCDKSEVGTKKIPTTKQKARTDRLQTSKFKPEWSKIFPSIQYSDGAMYCTDCKDAGLSNTFTIGCQTFLKDNIRKHIKTADHKRAIQTKAMRPTWNQGVATAYKQHEAEIISAMNNIYWMAKTNQPNSLFQSVNELLEHHVRVVNFFFK